MPDKYPSLNTSISNRNIFWGKKVGSSCSDRPSAPPQKNHRTSAHLGSCVQAWVHHRIQRQVSPRSKVVGIVISCIKDLLKGNARFCCTCPVAGGTVTAPGVWCPSHVGPHPSLSGALPTSSVNHCSMKKAENLIMKMTLTSRGPRDPQELWAYFENCCSPGKHFVEIFRDPVFVPSCCHSTAWVASWEHCSCTSGNRKSHIESTLLVYCWPCPQHRLSLCLTVSTVP